QGSDDWAPFNQNLPSVIVNELEIYYDLEDMSNSTMYAATYGRGLWKTPLPATTEHEITIANIDNQIVVPEDQGADFDVIYYVNLDFNAGNVFTAYLSDENGDFSADTEIGNVTSIQNGTIPVSLPGTTVAGDGYKIKVISSDPVTEKETNVFQIVKDDTTPVIELEDEDESLEIFPNPSSGFFTVQSAKISEESMVKVYDINGKLIKEINNNQQGRIDINLSGHTSGVYIIDIETNAEHMKAKVMLK
ncbi:MAG: T9SS type A sorting domain-containing protein, partial [Bacteroidota bacterium]